MLVTTLEPIHKLEYNILWFASFAIKRTLSLVENPLRKKGFQRKLGFIIRRMGATLEIPHQMPSSAGKEMGKTNSWSCSIHNLTINATEINCKHRIMCTTQKHVKGLRTEIALQGK